MISHDPFQGLEVAEQELELRWTLWVTTAESCFPDTRAHRGQEGQGRPGRVSTPSCVPAALPGLAVRIRHRAAEQSRSWQNGWSGGGCRRGKAGDQSSLWPCSVPAPELRSHPSDSGAAPPALLILQKNQPGAAACVHVGGLLFLGVAESEAV